MEKKGKYTVAVNGKMWDRACDAVWDPVFSPEGDKILIRTVEGGVYHRHILPVSDFS